jgi:hypothetical protein
MPGFTLYSSNKRPHFELDSDNSLPQKQLNWTTSGAKREWDPWDGEGEVKEIIRLDWPCYGATVEDLFGSPKDVNGGPPVHQTLPWVIGGDG